MPLTEAEHFGTNADGSKNEEYCVWCYKEGTFQQQGTMEEMIEHNLKYLDEFNAAGGTNYTKEEAREELRKFFPQLKRWKS